MSSSPQIVLIAALGAHGVIGREGALPWHLPDDLKRFKALTLGKPIVMGRKTFDAIGRPLPHRRNLVLSRALDTTPGVEVVHSLEEALALTDGVPELFVIGGGEVYAAFLPLATRLELTHVEADVDGDARFPAFAPSEWSVVADEPHAADGRHRWPMRFVTYVRR